MCFNDSSYRCKANIDKTEASCLKCGSRPVACTRRPLMVNRNCAVVWANPLRLTCARVCVCAAPSGWSSGGRVPGSETAAAAGDGVTQCLPEQDQDSDRGSARARAAETGAEGLTAPSTPWTEGLVLLLTSDEPRLELVCTLFKKTNEPLTSEEAFKHLYLKECIINSDAMHFISHLHINTTCVKIRVIVDTEN